MTPEQIAALTPEQITALPTLEELGGLRQRAEAFASAEARWGEERAMLGAGLADPEGQDLARYLYGRTPEADRPAFGDWLTQHGKTHRSLSPFFGGSAPATPAPATPAPAAPPHAAPPAPPPPGAVRAPVPPAATGASPAPAAVPAGAGGTDAAGDAIVERCRRSGDWSEYDRLRSEILRQASARRG